MSTTKLVSLVMMAVWLVGGAAPAGAECQFNGAPKAKSLK